STAIVVFHPGDPLAQLEYPTQQLVLLPPGLPLWRWQPVVVAEVWPDVGADGGEVGQHRLICRIGRVNGPDEVDGHP
ncbi:MAG: hypothetical protein ACYS0H_25610, partial [Planctomycetota bacterium]